MDMANKYILHSETELSEPLCKKNISWCGMKIIIIEMLPWQWIYK